MPFKGAASIIRANPTDLQEASDESDIMSNLPACAEGIAKVIRASKHRSRERRKASAPSQEELHEDNSRSRSDVKEDPPEDKSSIFSIADNPEDLLAVQDCDVDYVYNQADWAKPTPSTSIPSGSKPRSDQSVDLSADEQEAQPCPRSFKPEVNYKTGKGKGTSINKLAIEGLTAIRNKVEGIVFDISTPRSSSCKSNEEPDFAYGKISNPSGSSPSVRDNHPYVGPQDSRPLIEVCKTCGNTGIIDKHGTTITFCNCTYGIGQKQVSDAMNKRKEPSLPRESPTKRDSVPPSDSPDRQVKTPRHAEPSSVPPDAATPNPEGAGRQPSPQPVRALIPVPPPAPPAPTPEPLPGSQVNVAPSAPGPATLTSPTTPPTADGLGAARLEEMSTYSVQASNMMEQYIVDSRASLRAMAVVNEHEMQQLSSFIPRMESAHQFQMETSNAEMSRLRHLLEHAESSESTEAQACIDQMNQMSSHEKRAEARAEAQFMEMMTRMEAIASTEDNLRHLAEAHVFNIRQGLLGQLRDQFLAHESIVQSYQSSMAEAQNTYTSLAQRQQQEAEEYRRQCCSWNNDLARIRREAERASAEGEEQRRLFLEEREKRQLEVDTMSREYNSLQHAYSNQANHGNLLEGRLEQVRKRRLRVAKNYRSLRREPNLHHPLKHGSRRGLNYS